MSGWFTKKDDAPSQLSTPLLPHRTDEDEQRTGSRKAGLYTGLNALLTIPVGGMHTVIFTTILAAYTFTSGTEVQGDQALLGIRIGTGLVPALSALFAIIPMALSPINFTKERALSEFSEQQHRDRNVPQASV